MLSLTQPTPDDIRQLADRLTLEPLTYPVDLLDRVDTEPRLPRQADGWYVDRHAATIGNGHTDFEAACRALHDWRQFDRRWTVLAATPTPIREGHVVAYAARVAGTWWGYGCRILHVIDEPTRFGFIYGTVGDHAERGEERFLVELTGTGDVEYSLFAMSRPGRWFAWPGMPIARQVQAKFRRTSSEQMRVAVRELATTGEEQ